MSGQGRIIGLSRSNYGGEPFLSTFQRKNVKKPEEIEEDVEAPPKSSDDEMEEKFPSPRDLKDEVESSGDEASRGKKDIQPAKFMTNTRGGVNEKTNPSSKSTKGSSQFDTPSSSKRSAEEMAKDSGAHLKNEYGFLKNSNPYRNKPAQYGKNTQKTSSQKPAPKSSGPKEKSPEKKKFKNYSEDLLISPKKERFSGVQFKAPSMQSSPEKGGSKPGFRRTEMQSEESPRVARKLKRPGQDRKKENRKSSPAADEPSNQRPIFQNPFAGLEFGDDSKKAIGRALGSDTFDEASDNGKPQLGLSLDEDLASDTGELQPNTSRCPMCHAPVDPELLRKHSEGGRMNIKKQTLFCRLHKRKSAENARKDKEYPDIDWANLESRFREHQEFIKSILQGDQSSYYATLLSQNVETGRNRTLLKTDNNLTPGYYGPRGLRIMTDFIMHTFSGTVRKRAIEDRLVSARGYTGYVQSVLVPELAVRLIMEDMRASEEKARDILRESIELGDFLHEEARDVVTKESDEED